MSALLVGLALLLAGAAVSLFVRSARASAQAALCSQALAAALVSWSAIPVLAGGPALASAWAGPQPVGVVSLQLDALSAFFLVWSLPMTWLGTLYATEYLRPQFERGRRAGPHFALLNLIAASFVIIYAVQNALVFLLGWEIAAVAAWLLVIWDYTNQRIRFAGFNYLVSTHVGLFVLVAAFMRMHGRTDSLDFASFGAFLSRPSSLRNTVFLLLGLAFALKSAFFPFHTWLPRAHSAAPAHVSALMSGVIHKAGLFGFLRFTLLMGRPEEWMGWTVLGFGALSAVCGAVYTVPQRDLKRMLGYSSTENVGIAAMGFGVGYLGWTWNSPALAAAGFGGGLLHILNHALFKCALFYAAGSVYRATHTVDLERLGGLARRLPWTAGMFLIGGLAISGVPPLNGFASELLIYSGLLSGSAPHALGHVGLVASAALLALTGAISALSMTRAFGVAFLGNPREPGVHVTGGEPPAILAPMVLHAAGAVAIGLVPALGLALVAPVLACFPIGIVPGGPFAVLEPAARAGRLLAAAGLGAGLWAWHRGRSSRTSATWGCGYTASTARMQYTGSSFSATFARLFRSVLPSLSRERLPVTPFPEHESHLATHHYDAVERRVFEVLGQGEEAVTRIAERIPQAPRFAFAAGLAALVAIGVLVTMGAGPR